MEEVDRQDVIKTCQADQSGEKVRFPSFGACHLMRLFLTIVAVLVDTIVEGILDICNASWPPSTIVIGWCCIQN